MRTKKYLGHKLSPAKNLVNKIVDPEIIQETLSIINHVDGA